MLSNHRALPLVILCVVALAGCSSKPRASSAESMDLIKQVYTACNTRNLERLEAAENKLKELVDQQLLTEEERVEFEAIVDLAHDRKWEESQRRAMAFAQAQVR